jgi:Rod binding domain-containing protein
MPAPLSSLTSQAQTAAPRMPQTAGAKTATQAHKAAVEFEAVFVSQMLQQMFTGIDTDKEFGGGNAEQMWRSQLLDQYGRMVAHRGNGIGISAAVERSLLKHQEVR